MTKSPSVPTTSQSLGALLKSARDIMRKDKGLNGDLGGKSRQDAQDLQDNHRESLRPISAGFASCPSC